jgi:putative ABC transport system permease protein
MRGGVIRDLWQDVRYGVRVLGRAPAFTAVVVLVLGVSIAASTLLFTAINGMLLRPLPFAAPDRLVALRETNLARSADRVSVSAPNYIDWRDGCRTLAGLGAYRYWGFVLTGAAEPERVVGARVSANLFALLGVQPLRGRLFQSGEDRYGDHHVLLLSEELGRRRYGADAGLLGKALALDGEPYTVVGIVARDAALPPADLWVPLALAPYELTQRGNRALTVVGRLRAGVTLSDARQELTTVSRDLAQRYPESNAGWGVTVVTLQRDIAGALRTPLVLLFGATCALLLVAGANLANLLLARNAARRPEFALRAALGAGRGRIVRQLVTEVLLAVVVGGAFGLLLAVAGLDLVAKLGATFVPRRVLIIDGFVIGFVGLATCGIGLAMAALLTADFTYVDPHQPAPPSRPGRVGLRDTLVVGQIAVALLLLVGAGLLVRSLVRTQSADLGFAPSRVLSMTIALPEARYAGVAPRVDFHTDLARRLTGLRDVRGSGLVSHLPLAGGTLTADVTVAGRWPGAHDAGGTAHLVSVDSGYFRTMGIRLLRGRPFTGADGINGSRVAIIDETLAQQFWPGRDAVGEHIRVGATIGADTAWRRVVGVVAGVRATRLEASPAPSIYLPYAQTAWPSMTLVVLSRDDPGRIAGAVRAEILAVDPDQPVYNVRTLQEVVDRAAASRRFGTLLLGGFAAAALVLAVLGVYGILAYAVAQRTREVGIRVALGARSSDVLALVIRRALVPIAVGLVIGGLAAAAGSRVLASLLFEVSPWDPIAFVGAAGAVAIAGLLASYLPARRAAHLDPVVALRRD